MKKGFITALFFLFLTTTVSAQYKSFQFGFHVSPNIGWLKPTSDNVERTGSRMGFDWGFVGEFYFVENYAFSTGFNVSFINTKYEANTRYNLNFATLKRDLNTQYVEIPLILKMKTNELGFLRIYAEVGYGLGFRLNAEATDNIYNESKIKVDSENHHVKDEVKMTRSALILGAGVEIPLGGSTFVYGGIRFNNCFSNVLKDQLIAGENFKYKGISNFLALKFGLMF